MLLEVIRIEHSRISIDIKSDRGSYEKPDAARFEGLLKQGQDSVRGIRPGERTEPDEELARVRLGDPGETRRIGVVIDHSHGCGRVMYALFVEFCYADCHVMREFPLQIHLCVELRQHTERVPVRVTMIELSDGIIEEHDP